jgi:hypothetical protein
MRGAVLQYLLAMVSLFCRGRMAVAQFCATAGANKKNGTRWVGECQDAWEGHWLGASFAGECIGIDKILGYGRRGERHDQANGDDELLRWGSPFERVFTGLG